MTFQISCLFFLAFCFLTYALTVACTCGWTQAEPLNNRGPKNNICMLILMIVSAYHECNILEGGEGTNTLWFSHIIAPNLHHGVEMSYHLWKMGDSDYPFLLEWRCTFSSVTIYLYKQFFHSERFPYFFAEPPSICKALER